MHTREVNDATDGTFHVSEPAASPCTKCGGLVMIHVWESSCGGFEDEKHKCMRCGHYVWIESIDS